MKTKQPLTAEEVDYTLDVISMAIKTLNAEVLELRKRVEALENKPSDYEREAARRQYEAIMNIDKL